VRVQLFIETEKQNSDNVKRACGVPKVSRTAFQARRTGARERVGTLARGRGRITTFEKIVQIADVTGLWQAGQTCPGLMRRYENATAPQALRVPGLLLGLAARPWEADSAPTERSRTENGPHVHRRTILQAAASTGLAATLPALHRPDPPSRITNAYVDRTRTDGPSATP
jgi:hypothetical protein